MAPKESWTFFGVARKETGSQFIAIGELHVSLAWDIRVIPLREQIHPKIS
jgi:hypothetical protein